MGMKTLGDFTDLLILVITLIWVWLNSGGAAVCVSAAGVRLASLGVERQGEWSTVRTQEAREGGNWKGALVLSLIHIWRCRRRG